MYFIQYVRMLERDLNRQYRIVHRLAIKIWPAGSLASSGLQPSVRHHETCHTRPSYHTYLLLLSQTRDTRSALLLRYLLVKYKSAEYVLYF